jgi:Tfp pilus assembly ATPase PilU
MDQSLAELCLAGKINRNEALEKCIDKTEIERLLQSQSYAGT